MGNVLNPDFQEFILELNTCKVKYVLVGGYAVIYHGYNRTTGDLDIYVERSIENYNLLCKAFKNFGLALFDMTEENFLDESTFEVFTFGNPPVSIDIITSLKGVLFSQALALSQIGTIDNISVRVLHKNGLIEAKTKSGRAKDLADIEMLNESE